MNGRNILAFHIGRGGRFFNGGHLTYVGLKTIDRFTDNLFLNGDQTEFVDCHGNEVGLSAFHDGTGIIDIDGEYNTTYCKYLDDLEDNEMEAVMRDEFNLDILEFYVKNINPYFEYDLLPYYSELPRNVQSILDGIEPGYDNCAIAIEQLEDIGYTADYGLDGELIDLKFVV